MTSDQGKEAIEKGYAWVAGLAELRNVKYIDLRRAIGRCGRARGS
jgi:hypothetical protein